MTFLTYQLKVAVIMAVFYIFFRLLLIKDTWHRLNRIVLLSTALLSFLLPVCIITIHKTEVLPMPVDQLMQAVSSTPAQPSAPWWHIALMTVYAAGVVFVLAKVLTSALRVRSIIRHARKEVSADGTTVYVMPGNDPSFSWMGHIVISEADWNNHETAVIDHEKAHVALHHSIDVLITDIIAALQWFNPAIWMLRIDLRAVHEYEADDTVLRAGADIRSYQYLLISKAAAMNGYTIANNFNHSILKNRIFMMEKERTTRRSLLRALYLLPLVCISLALNAQTKVTYVYDDGKKSSGQLTYDDGDFTMTTYKIPEGQSIDSMINTLPGVQVGDDGTVTVNGKPIKRIIVNGKEVNLKDGESPTKQVEEMIRTVQGAQTQGRNASSPVTIARINADGDTLRFTGAMKYDLPDPKSSEDFLRITGVEVNYETGEIKQNGRPVKKVLINGKEADADQMMEFLKGNYDQGMSVNDGDEGTIKSIDENGNTSIDTKNGIRVNLNGTQVAK